MKKTLILLIFMFLGIGIQNTKGQFRIENLYIKGGLGLTFYPKANQPADTGFFYRTKNVYSGFRNGVTFNLGLEYYINKRWAVEINWALSGANKTLMSVGLFELSSAFKYYIRPNTKYWSPYVKGNLSLGSLTVTKNEITDTVAGRRLLNRALSNSEFRDKKDINMTTLLIGFGAGLDVRLTRRLTAFVEYNYHYGLFSNSEKLRSFFRNQEEAFTYQSFTGGLKYRLFKPEPDDYMKLNLFINDLDTKLPIPAAVSIRDSSDKLEDLQYAGTNGKLSKILGAENSYDIKVSLAGYSQQKFKYNLYGFKGKKDENRIVELYKNAFLKLKVIDSATQKNMTSFFRVYKSGKLDTSLKVISTDTLGYYKVLLPYNEKYHIVATRPGSKSDSIYFETPYLLDQRVFEKQMKLNSRFVKYQFEAFDALTKNSIDFDVTLSNMTMDEGIIKPTLNREGRYEVMLREGHQYRAVATGRKGYAYEYATLDVPISGKMSKNDSIVLRKLRFNIISLQKGNTLLLREILFKYNSNEVYEDSYDELNRIAKLMKDNPKMTVEIGGHTDNVGSAAANLRLSEKRAGYIVEYMINQGISKNRLVAKGFGKTKPIVPNDTEENKAKNRRLEMVVLSND
ncbi:MAG: OmpA family protein [Bacteroidota bacterium]|nr:OmpA family protein [Bacteroidota bacterium]